MTSDVCLQWQHKKLSRMLTPVSATNHQREPSEPLRRDTRPTYITK